MTSASEEDEEELNSIRLHVKGEKMLDLIRFQQLFVHLAALEASACCSDVGV